MPYSFTLYLSYSKVGRVLKHSVVASPLVTRFSKYCVFNYGIQRPLLFLLPE